MDGFSEHEQVPVGSPLRQGDVLEAVARDAEVWSSLLVVITADCDLAQSKNAGRITCVPLLDTHEYLHLLQLPRLRTRLMAKQQAAVQDLLNKSGVEISDTRLSEITTEVEPDELLTMLDAAEVHLEALSRGLASMQRLQVSRATLDEEIAELVEAQVNGLNAPSRANAIKNATEPLRAVFKNPPGDAFFLNSVAPGRDTGYFAYLRHLEQIQEHHVSTYPLQDGVTHRRVGRLRDRYTHALVQRFAQVFMTIGLPVEYETMRDARAAHIGESIQ